MVKFTVRIEEEASFRTVESGKLLNDFGSRTREEDGDVEVKIKSKNSGMPNQNDKDASNAKTDNHNRIQLDDSTQQAVVESKLVQSNNR